MMMLCNSRTALMYLLLPFTLMVFPAFEASAQKKPSPFEDEMRTFWGGLAIGANFTQVDGDGFSGFNKVGLNAGPVMYVRLGASFGASMEFYFSQKGSKVRKVTESPYVGQYIEYYDLKLNYVEVPLFFHYMPPGRLHFSLGASYAYLLSSKETAETNAPVNLDPELYPFLNRDINLIVGGNYHLGGNWYVNARYAYSMMTIRDPQRVPQYYGGGNKQVNNLFTFRLMYLF